MSTKFRVHYESERDGRGHRDVVAESPQQAAALVKTQLPRAVIVKIKRVREE